MITLKINIKTHHSLTLTPLKKKYVNTMLPTVLQNREKKSAETW